MGAYLLEALVVRRLAELQTQLVMQAKMVMQAAQAEQALARNPETAVTEGKHRLGQLKALEVK